MSTMPDYARGRRDGIRWAITWLHAEAKRMNDPKAVGILNDAAFHMGVANKKGDELAANVAETPPRSAAEAASRHLVQKCNAK